MSYDHRITEQKWNDFWENEGIYKYKKGENRTFSIDTPPPTVSGSLHIGHIFSYTQTDVIVRHKRMCGFNICYPIGWDDNGLPTERRVQNYFGIKCNPSIEYDPLLTYEQTKTKEIKEVSRQNFIEACEKLVNIDEKIFENVFRSVGHSYDWSFKYSTIDSKSVQISQLSFIELFEKGLAYTKEIPTMWDITFQSAVANAEIEDRDVNGKFYDIEFETSDHEKFTIATTRPELLPACIAIVANPADERYKHLFGKTAITPAFFVPVPILPSDHVLKDKGTGIMMICTFGDIQDVEWWKKSGLPMKQIINKQGKIIDLEYGNGNFVTINQTEAIKNYNKIKGLHVKKARSAVVEILKEYSKILGEKDISHSVKFYEKGDQPIEFIPSRQWFIDIINHKDELLEAGRKIIWHPEYMLSRYEHWVNGINQDWCISRQRFFGVPFPVWYRLDKDMKIDYEHPIIPNKDSLPVDPAVSTPNGFSNDMRGKPNGFIADLDVMDTWATSSMTPYIVSGWKRNSSIHKDISPMDMRAQSHDIIRTWAFYTILKAWFHDKTIPWKNITISGFIVDPDRKKMSKSKGNVITPGHLIEEYSADAVRYWASKAKLGNDTIFDEKVFKIGKKLINKIYNAGKFVKTILDQSEINIVSLSLSDIICDSDITLMKLINQCIQKSTEAFEKFNYSESLQITEDLFWKYCDYYVELVKKRAYDANALIEEKKSVLATLFFSFKTLLKLFAPFMPYITEESFTEFNTENEKSIHTSKWPEQYKDFKYDELANLMFNIITEVLSEVRGIKTSYQKGMSTPIEEISFSGSRENIGILKLLSKDLSNAINVNPEHIVYVIDNRAKEGKLFEINVKIN